MWTQKGEQPQIPTLGNHEKVNLFGTVNPLLGEAFCVPTACQNAQEFQTFLEAVLDRYAAKEHILLILDNARSHHAKYLRPFLKKHRDKLELLFLPPYSPNLNVMERIWRFIRKIVSHNTFFETFKKFTAALFSFLKQLSFPSASLCTLCGNFLCKIF